MRTLALVAAFMAGIGVTRGAVQTGGPKIVVYWNRDVVRIEIAQPAAALTSKIYAVIGMPIEWHFEQAPRGRNLANTILIHTANKTPESFRPGALAFAEVDGGAHITLLYDRIQSNVEGAALPQLLGHVLAHEIGHVLQGQNRHSVMGVMKAHWDSADCTRMRWQPLTFTPQDVDLIRDGMAARASGSR